ncbi:hypothetical protein B0T21DRAFT_255964, partial [Apiosordaria backusii]
MRSVYDYELPPAELYDYLGSNDALNAFLIAAKSTGEEKKLTNVFRRTVEQGAFSSGSNANPSVVYLRSILQDAFEAGGSGKREPNAMWRALQSQNFTRKIDIESLKASLRQEHSRSRARFKAYQRSAQSIGFLDSLSVPHPGSASAAPQLGPPAPWLTSPSCLAPTESYVLMSSPPAAAEEDVSSRSSATMDFVSVQTGSTATLNQFTPAASNASRISDELHFPVSDHSFLLKDYIFDQNTFANIYLCQCCLCGEPQTLQMFILRSPYTSPLFRTQSTQINSPEPFILPASCCDACLETLKHMQTLPNGERVDEGLPRMPLTNGTNHRIWMRTLSKATDTEAIHKCLEPAMFSQFLSYPLDNFAQLVGLIAL